MNDSPTTPKELHAGDIVIIEEGWRLVAGGPCEARLQKRLFYPRSKAWDVFLAIVLRGGQTIVAEVNPWTRRAKLLEVRNPKAAQEGGQYVGK